MNKDFVKNTIKDYMSAGNKINAYYVTYKPFQNATTQKWGSIKNENIIDEILSEIETSKCCIQGELPIVRLIIYSDDQALAFIENKLWDCVNDESEHSHVIMTIPFISSDGKFGRIVEWNSNQFRLTSDELVGHLLGFPLGVVVKMMEYQLAQGNAENVEVFCKDATAGKADGGFDWELTKEDFYFWSCVIDDRDFDVFFKKYPDYKKYNM